MLFCHILRFLASLDKWWILGQSRKGLDRPIFANSETATSALESLEGLFSGLTWFSGWKMDKTYILGQNLPSKPPNCPKFISRKPFVVESWLTLQNDHKDYFTMGVVRFVYPSEKHECPEKTIFCFLGTYNKGIAWFSIISWTAGRINLIEPSKQFPEWIYYERSMICIPLRQPEMPKKWFFLLFRTLFNKISKVSISQELCLILNWLTF